MNKANASGKVLGAYMSLPSLLEANRLRTIKIRSKYVLNPKKCKECSIVLEYGKRRCMFCSHSCAGRYNNKGTARNGILSKWYGRIRPCGACGGPVKNHYQKYCSRRCSHDGEYLKYIALWKSGEVSGVRGDSVSVHIAKYIKNKLNNKCSKCRWGVINEYTGKVPVQIHHVDGDPYNNKEENLDLLCPNCHSLTGNYGSRNKGKGRDSRGGRRKRAKV